MHMKRQHWHLGLQHEVELNAGHSRERCMDCRSLGWQVDDDRAVARRALDGIAIDARVRRTRREAERVHVFLLKMCPQQRMQRRAVFQHIDDLPSR